MATIPGRARAAAAVVPLSDRMQISLSREELATAVGVHPSTIARLVRLGAIEPLDAEPERFTAATVLRLRRMLRLHHDLGVNFIGAAIIADILERLEQLERDAAAGR